MTTAAVPITITCPEWCTETPEHHASELWNLGGTCIHAAEGYAVEDLTGYREALEEPRYGRPVAVWFSTETDPDGRETTSPVFFIDGRELTVSQALAVAETIETLVGQYRASGGIE